MTSHPDRVTWALSPAACLLVLVLSGCDGDSAPAAVPASSVSVPSGTTSVRLPPLPDPETASERPAPSTLRTSTGAPAAGDYCGTVTAASGLTLRVMLGEGALDCTEAKRVVAAFHRAIEGEQSAESDEPVSATVDGWHCVSGPPSAQGGTSCSIGQKNVLGAVVTEE